MKPNTPTKIELHLRIADLERERNEHRNAAMEADLRTQAAVRGEKQLEGKLTAVTRWLEANQPDVFKRGLWDAIDTPTARTTLCWNCNTAYPTDARQCPGCCATNANKDLVSAQEEMQDKTQIDHDWKWVSDWYGDPEVVNGTADCSHWKCTRCDSEDCEDEPPGPYEDY